MTIAVVDTGLDFTHEDMAANVWYNQGERGLDTNGNNKQNNNVDDDGNGYVDDWRGYDFTTSDGTPIDNDPTDDQGHGTHVAGTIAAVGNNNAGIIGVAPQAKVMVVDAFNGEGSASTADLVQAIRYAADNGAKVINCSWGSRRAKGVVYPLQDTFTYAHDIKGVVMVAGAGNSSTDVSGDGFNYFPANLRDAIAVSALTHQNQRANFSNYGTKIDVAAPGGGSDVLGSPSCDGCTILSLFAKDTTAYTNVKVGEKYARLQGTSMAAPHVSGVAALIRAQHPEYTPEQVRQVLRASSSDLGAPGFDVDFGYGRLNAADALAVTTPLAAQLSEEIPVVYPGVNVQIRGTAAGVGLANWRLEYGAGRLPTSWTQITSATGAVTEGLLAWWNAELADGEYTLRLVAVNSQGRAFEDRMPFVVDSVVITSPSSSVTPVYREGTISIEGTVAPLNFASYTIKIKGDNTGWLTNPAITLTNNGQQRVYNGVLGTWNTAGVATDSYTIYIIITLSNGNTIEERMRVIVDPTLHSGWPQALGESTPFATPPDQHLVVYDVDRDGDQEILVSTGKQVYLYDHTGAVMPGWPQTVDADEQGNKIVTPLAVGDLTGDGSPEVIAASGIELSKGGYRKVFVWTSNGNTLPGWPKTLSEIPVATSQYTIFEASLMIDDVDNNGKNELIVVDSTKVHVFNSNGTQLPGWPVSVEPTSGNHKGAVGDLDGDGQKEIVVSNSGLGNNSAKVFVLNSTGGLKWSKNLPPTTQNYLLKIANIDNDSQLEIIGKRLNEDFASLVLAYNHDGTSVNGWPQATDSLDLFGGGEVAVGDITGDGKAEVVAAGNASDSDPENWDEQGVAYAWRGNGTRLPNWPIRNIVTPSDPDVIEHARFSAPILTDVDVDGKADVIVSTVEDFTLNSNAPRGSFALRAYKADGTAAAGFPKPTVGWLGVGVGINNSPAVGDIDGDGLLELAWIDNRANLYVWDLPTPATAAAQPWPMYQHDAARTGNAQNLVTAPTAPKKARADFDGDGKTDLSVFRPAEGRWYVQGSRDGFASAQWGVNDDRLAPADYDGDRKTDYAVFRPSTGMWYVILSGSGAVRQQQWGQAGDVPVVGNFAGDARADYAVFRPSTGMWYILPSDERAPVYTQFGAAGDVPVSAADFDGDGKADVAVYRALAGTWYWIESSTQEYRSERFGASSDVAVAGRYDNDNKTDLAVFRNGLWYYRASASNNEERVVQFGQAGDVAVLGDYDGDGREEPAVYRAGAWYIASAGGGGYRVEQFGLLTDRPLPAQPQP